MAKTLQELFGTSASFNDGIITLNYQELAVLAGIDPSILSSTPSGEAIAGQILSTLNKTTRLATDGNGFPVPDNTQAIISSNIEPRRVFVTREETNQVKLTLFFDIYLQDVNGFVPGILVS